MTVSRKSLLMVVLIMTILVWVAVDTFAGPGTFVGHTPTVGDLLRWVWTLCGGAAC